LLDEAATQAALRNAFAALARSCDVDSTVFIYISSHGGRIESGEHAGEYLLPVDTVYDSAESVAQTAISGVEFTAALRAIPARKVIVVFDCCHAGGIGQPKDATAPEMKNLPESYYDALKGGRGRVILASSRSTESSWVLPDAENSIFTHHLLGGLRGGIASDDGLIRIFDLFEYVQPRVTVDQPNQHPLFKAEIEESFPVALYLGGQKGVVEQDELGFRYDAYISYAEEDDRDAGWVWDELLPRLEAAGLRVAVSDDVARLGVARVINMERGVEQARRVVVVLSHEYLADRMAQFENVMAQTMSWEEGIARLIPIKIEPIDLSTLPRRLRANFAKPADLTRPGRRTRRRLEQLVETLRSPLAASRFEE
jgi:hypothetical protein